MTNTPSPCTQLWRLNSGLPNAAWRSTRLIDLGEGEPRAPLMPRIVSGESNRGRRNNG